MRGLDSRQAQTTLVAHLWLAMLIIFIYVFINAVFCRL